MDTVTGQELPQSPILVVALKVDEVAGSKRWRGGTSLGGRRNGRKPRRWPGICVTTTNPVKRASTVSQFRASSALLTTPARGGG